MERLLYEASVEGNTTVLQNLLQKDPLILDKVTLNQHDDMPLHIASMLGHIDFVNEILTRKPKLSMECDSQRRLPLHIACAKGHVEIVKVLLSVNPQTCVARDRDGRNPLHLAAVKGHCEVVKELVLAQPHAARAMVQQETILHLCVKHNQLEVLKLLVETVGDHEFVNTKDADGNTILHLAVADKQIETVNFLLLYTTIEMNASNTNGETSMDLLAQGPRDMEDQRIVRCLTLAGVVDLEEESLLEQNPQNSKSKLRFDNMKPHLKKDSKDDEDWFRQEEKHFDGCFIIDSHHGLSSSGLPFLKHKAFLWVLMIIMWIATTSMSITYGITISVLTPKPEAQTFKNVVTGIVLVWVGLMTLLVAGHAIRLMDIFQKLPSSSKNAIMHHT
ncbi:hypothetical protein L1987_70407 [Smallanthus sonchifolius]|uniref:Uncharacterized protein n=1 Tax=Smallanthus sonchifolius TaxID=185202 RepID=A0ACB9AR48_9ASTR|nr:hypothetical protein L1987_70407 [Smallanthus sonchifolius]